MPDYSPARDIAAREASRFAILMRIDLPTPVRLWCGVGDIATRSDDELDPSQTYEGNGVLLSMPPLRSLLGGQAESVQFVFNGADPLPRSWMDDPDIDINGAIINLGRVFFDDAWQAVAPVAWTWTLTAGAPRSVRKGLNCSVVLSALSDGVDRSDVSNLMWTRAGHRSRHPTDSFFDWRARYNRVYRPKWD